MPKPLACSSAILGLALFAITGPTWLKSVFAFAIVCAVYNHSRARYGAHWENVLDIWVVRGVVLLDALLLTFHNAATFKWFIFLTAVVCFLNSSVRSSAHPHPSRLLMCVSWCCECTPYLSFLHVIFYHGIELSTESTEPRRI